MNKALLKSFIVRYDKTQFNLARAMGISLSSLMPRLMNQMVLNLLKAKFALLKIDIVLVIEM